CWLIGLLFFIATHARAQALITPSADLVVPPATSAAPAVRDVPSTPVFRAGVDLVALNVVVTDARQRFVAGLTANDFAVYEDGVQQDVSFFAAAMVPLDLALLLDTSASMQDKMQTMQEAALGFLATLRPGDRAAVLEIKDRVDFAYALGGDIESASGAVRGTIARGGTSLYNGLYLAIKEMVKQRKANGDVRRQAIAVLSDGEDTASLVAYDDVLDLAKQAGITIYTITLKSPFALKQASLSGRRYFSQSEFAMKSLAHETGARAFFPNHIRELSGVYGSIAQELANQYAIGYSSKNPRRDGAFRRVIVRVAERPDARARTRSGYLARLTNSH
ncbi:MAG: VWA domain-containing protein, partial [Steroidobacteraceae bacterium]